MTQNKDEPQSLGVGFLTSKKEWLTVKEACIFLDISSTTLRTYARERENFPSRKEVSARKIYYSSKLLRKWYKSIGGEK